MKSLSTPLSLVFGIVIALTVNDTWFPQDGTSRTRLVRLIVGLLTGMAVAFVIAGAMTWLAKKEERPQQPRE